MDDHSQSVENQTLINDWVTKNEFFVSVIDWDVENYQIFMTTGISTDETYFFQIGCNHSWIPWYVCSAAKELESWVERMNTFAQRKQEQMTVPQFLKEAEISLMLYWKIQPPSETPEKVPSTSISSVHNNKNKDNAGAGNVSAGIRNRVGGWSYTRYTPPNFLENPTTTESPSKTAESVKAEINAWIDKNEGCHLVLRDLVEDKYTLELSIGDPPMDFEIHCDKNWNLKSVSSSNDDLKNLIPIITTYLLSTKPSINTFCTHFSLVFGKEGEKTVIKSIDEIKTALEDAEEIIEEAEEEEKVDPTPDDWESIIFPELQNLLSNDNNMETWQIDGWLGQVRMEYEKCMATRNFKPCLDFVMRNLLGGAMPPNPIKKFFKKTPPSRWIHLPDATESAIKLLQAQAEEIEKMNCKAQGFSARPIRNNLFHWQINLFDFDRHSHIQQQLVHYTLSTPEEEEDDPALMENDLVKTLDIIFEIKFPKDYPNGSPLFRLIRPRFEHFDEETFDLTDQPEEDEGTTTTTTTTKTAETMEEDEGLTASPYDPEVSDLDQPPKHPLSVSMQLEKKDWKRIPKVLNIVKYLRNMLNNTSIKIDIESCKEGIPTDGSFWQEYSCAPLSIIDSRSESEVGGKIYLPQSALSELMGSDFGGYGYGYGYGYYGSYASFRNSQNAKYSPMIFEISSKSGRSFCGVMEFISTPGNVGIPSWMMENLGIQPGQSVQIRKVTLPKGIHVQLQPHSEDFSKVQDIKAILEWVLRRFVALTVGDTVEIQHEHLKLKFDVIKCIPNRAIAITDQDVSVDFLKPLNCSDEKINQQQPLTQTQEIEALEKKLIINQKDAVTVVGQMKGGIEGTDYKICKNCKQCIPHEQITMHELRCERINWYCQPCQKVILKTDKEKHTQLYHHLCKCEWCGEKMENRRIVDHKKNECRGRNVSCKFCKLTMQYRNLWVHENSCGSRTEICSKCQNRYPQKDLEEHVAGCGSTRKSQRIPPPKRVSFADFPTYSKPEKQNDLILCEKCQQPFSTFDDYYIHILTQHPEFSHFYDDITTTTTTTTTTPPTASQTTTPQTVAPSDGSSSSSSSFIYEDSPQDYTYPASQTNSFSSLLIQQQSFSSFTSVTSSSSTTNAPLTTYSTHSSSSSATFSPVQRPNGVASLPSSPRVSVSDDPGAVPAHASVPEGRVPAPAPASAGAQTSSVVVAQEAPLNRATTGKASPAKEREEPSNDKKKPKKDN